MNLDPMRRPSMISGVSPRKWTGRPPGRPKGSLGEPRRLLLARLRPDQLVALRARAAKETPQGKRIDVSGALRRILDRALKLRAPK